MLQELYPAFCIVSSVVVIYGAALFSRKTKRFRWSEYVALMCVPVLGSLGLAYFYGFKIIYFFFVCSVVGFAFEYILGKAYHLLMHQRLWTYGKYSVEGYTSLLSLPMWGVGGVIFWMIAHTMGL